MKEKSLFRKSLIFFFFASIPLVVCVSAAGMALMGVLHAQVFGNSLLATAQSFAAIMDPESAISAGKKENTYSSGEIHPSPAAVFVSRLSAASGYRVTLILPDGTVLAESSTQPEKMENHASRPEIYSAMQGKPSIVRRVSTTLGKAFLYAAVPVVKNGSPVAVLRLAATIPDIQSQLAPFRLTLIVATILASVVAAVASWIFSRQISLPLEDLATLAETRLAVSSGNTANISIHTLPASSTAASPSDPPHLRPETRQKPDMSRHAGIPAEISLLYRTIDAMSRELQSRIESARSQALRFSTILESMGEAVVALDPDLRIIIANPAAQRLGRIPGRSIEGLSILEAIRSPELEAFASECISSGGHTYRDIAFFETGETWYRVQASPFPFSRSGDAAERGAVLALSDITELRRLGKVRTEFVANVSHELRTPIHLIKGFAETLLAGEQQDPEIMTRFLGIIAKNADRMGNIVSDLLSLARLEQDSGSWLATERIEARTVIREALDATAPLLSARKTRIETDCPADLFMDANLGLLEQALANLIDNAAKYSPEASLVRVGAFAQENMVVFTVEDEGPGIPLRDLPHIFERFYRVDKARSRQSGGTGLGLAIVRHIAIVHKGSATAKSSFGHGSRFEIAIPASEISRE